MKKMNKLLLLFAFVFLGLGAYSQCGTEGSFTIDQSELNLPRNGSSSYTTNSCGAPLLISATSTASDAPTDFVIYDSYFDGVAMNQYGAGNAVSTVTYTFDSPVKITNLQVQDIDQSSNYNDDVTVSATGANVNVVSVDPTVSIIGGNGTPSAQVRATSGTANSNGKAVFSTDGPVTQLTITYTDTNPVTGARYIYINDITACCPPSCTAGTAAPTMTDVTNFVASSGTYTIPCGSTTADLSTLVASNLPSGTSLTVHSGTPATNANKVNPATALATGTYYVAFYDATNDCYSPTTQITVNQETNCCQAGNVAPTVQ